MFPLRLFPTRLFALRLFPKVGATPIFVVLGRVFLALGAVRKGGTLIGVARKGTVGVGSE